VAKAPRFEPVSGPRLATSSSCRMPISSTTRRNTHGSRFVGGESHRVLYFWHSVGNKLLTLLSNAFTNLNLTDMETCYKAFRREIIQGITLQEDRFGFEPEVTGKIAAIPNCRIFEVGISYFGRTYEEGKKIGWRDAVRAVWCIWKYRPRGMRTVAPRAARDRGFAATEGLVPLRITRPRH
jgi:hypothetical protein